MGTRHLIAVQHNHEYKVAQYGQWDGYPEEQGVAVLEFLRTVNLSLFKDALAKCRFLDLKKRKDKAWAAAFDKRSAKDALAKCRFLDLKKRKDKAWAAAFDKRSAENALTPEDNRWYSTYISRGLGAKILDNILNSTDKEIVLSNEITFANDSVFCEWAYVIDLDRGVLEVYKGFQKEQCKDKTARFYVEKPDKESGTAYYAVALQAEFPLKKLPLTDRFIKMCLRKKRLTLKK